MSLSLYIDTASSSFTILMESDQQILFNSSQEASLDRNKDIFHIVNTGFEKIGKTQNDLDFIAVSIGPGATNAIRSGVSFANSLAYALGIPVCPFTSFELMGLDAWNKFKIPVICAAKAINGNAYLGLYKENRLVEMKFGKLNEILSEMTEGLTELALAGANQETIKSLLNECNCQETGDQEGIEKTLVGMKVLLLSRKTFYPDFAKPILENLKVFHE